MRYDLDWRPTREDIEFTALMIGGKIQEAREHARRFLIGLVFLTPVAIIVSFLFVTVAMAALFHGAGRLAITTGINVFIFFLWGIYSIFHTLSYGLIVRRIVMPLSGLIVLAGIDYLIGIKFASTWCWIAYLLVMYFTLAVMGYYFRWDKPQLFHCIHDPKSAQAIAAFQLSCAVPALMGRLYADLGEKYWLKQGLTRKQLVCSSLLLYSTLLNNSSLASFANLSGEIETKEIFDAMFNLNLLSFNNGRILVTDSAKQLLVMPNNS